MSSISKIKCENCARRSMFSNKCKCEKFFCLKCSPYYTHNCSYDWKQYKQKILIELNPQIVPIKVENI